MGKFTVNLYNINITVEMGSTLLFLALCGMAVAHPQMRQHITTSPCPTWRLLSALAGPPTSRGLSTRSVPSLLTDSALTTFVPSKRLQGITTHKAVRRKINYQPSPP